MRKIIFIFFVLFFAGCNSRDSQGYIYRCYFGDRDGYRVWIVDGSIVRKNIYNEFLYGGNEQRYPWIPKGEIWIDQSISSEEFDLTLAHELNERHLMARFGWSYDKSHDSSLQLEQVMRKNYAKMCREHEQALHPVAPSDHDGIKEIYGIPDSIVLEKIYRIPLGIRDGISVWVVDGYKVRAEIFPDFGLSGNDLAYHFIPEKEIWIDGQVSCEETEYSIATELLERKLMAQGMKWGPSYDSAINENTRKRTEMYKKSIKMPAIKIPDSIVNEIGKQAE